MLPLKLGLHSQFASAAAHWIDGLSLYGGQLLIHSFTQLEFLELTSYRVYTGRRGADGHAYQVHAKYWVEVCFCSLWRLTIGFLTLIRMLMIEGARGGRRETVVGVWRFFEKRSSLRLYVAGCVTFMVSNRRVSCLTSSLLCARNQRSLSSWLECHWKINLYTSGWMNRDVILPIWAWGVCGPGWDFRERNIGRRD